MKIIKISGRTLNTNGTENELGCYVFMERQKTETGEYLYKMRDDFFGSGILSEKYEIVTENADWAEVAYNYFAAAHELFYDETEDGKLFTAVLFTLD